MKSGSFWNYYKDEINDVDINDNALDGKSFEHKTKISRETPERSPRPPRPPQPPKNQDESQPPQPPVPALNLEVTIPLKYLKFFFEFS